MLRLPLALLAAAVVLAIACSAPPHFPEQSPAPDAGGPVVDAGTPDSGDAHEPDAGTPIPDAGKPFVEGFADEPCPEATWNYVPDGGVPDGSVLRGLCIALSTLQGTASIDGVAASAPIHVEFESVDHGSQIERVVAPDGRYVIRVLRGQYDELIYRPTEIGQHRGGKDLGSIDLRNNVSRDLAVKTWHVAGSALFAGQPWLSSASPPDLTVHADGEPFQSAWRRTTGGGYEVRLIEGAFHYSASVPFAALRETELTHYPIVPWLELNEDRTIDIDIPTSEFSGTVTINGAPVPDRLATNPEYRLNYVAGHTWFPVAGSIHEGGSSFFAAIVPSGRYSITLDLLHARDSRLPARLFNMHVATHLDLSRNAEHHVALTTHEIEGALAIDGTPVASKPGRIWTLYAFARSDETRPWFLSLYEVSLASAFFKLDAFPGDYYLSMWLDTSLHPALVEGWYEIDSARLVDSDVSLPIDIPTHPFDGMLLIDGEPAASTASFVGTLIFESTRSSYRHRLKTQDGRFHVRLPRERYTVSFDINPDAYPGYAAGREKLGTVDLSSQPAHATLHYRTVEVTGPLLVGNTVLPDSRGTEPEAGLMLRRRIGGSVLFARLEGGRPWYRIRVPKDDYLLSFWLEKDALDGVAWGNAPLGNELLLGR